MGFGWEFHDIPVYFTLNATMAVDVVWLMSDVCTGNESVMRIVHLMSVQPLQFPSFGQ